MLFLGLLIAFTALPDAASARPRGLPGIFGILTAPLRILGGVRHFGHYPRHSRRSVSRATPAAAGVAAGAAAAAAATSANSKETPPASAAKEATTEAARTAAPADNAAPVTKEPAAKVTAEPKPEPAPATAAASTAVATPAVANAPDTAEPSHTASAPAAANAPTTTAAKAPAAAPVPPMPAAQTAAEPAPQRSAALTPAKERQARPSAPHVAAKEAARPKDHFGLVGPLAWPSAFEDVVGYALWPKDYNEGLRLHGIGDIMATIFTPAGALADKARAGMTVASAESQGRAAPASASLCTNVGDSDWPAADIERGLQLNETQKTALHQLSTTVRDAVASIRATCRDDAKLNPIERMRAMQNTLWAVHDAALLIRAPLSRFYDTLSDAQRKQFAAPAIRQPDPRSASRADMARMCGMPASNDGLARHMEQSLRPTATQRASLEALQKKSFEMGQFLMASCFKPMPATPAERLDAAADRLTAVIFAASTMNLALNDFYSQLSAEQKSRLNSPGT
jgi:hypothetical protein